MNNAVRASCLLAGFTLAHAAWNVSDLPDSELLVPLAVVERGGQRELLRFEADTQEEAIRVGKRAMIEETDAEAWAFAREGALRVQATQSPQDALVVDFWVEGMKNPLTLIQPFVRYTKGGRFHVVGEMIVTSGGQMLDSTSMRQVVDAINEGIQEHPKVVELWHTSL